MWIVEIIFWVALGLVLYTLFVYPALSLLLAAIVRRKVAKAAITPKVSFIIAAYNEEEAIARKIEETLALDYPREQFEIIVASDGSTDGTDDIVRRYADRGVCLFRVEGRRGKTHMLNETVAHAATGDILIFSDATGVFSPNSIRELVANFNDPSVGCVAGRVAYRYGKDATSSGFKAYQRVAVAVRRAESRFGSQTSVSGAIHAMRRHLFRPGDPAYTLDVVDAIHTVAQGHRVVYEEDAVCLEDSRQSPAAEFKCRVRIAVRTTTMIPYIVGQLIRHGCWGYQFQVLSHKMLRWWLWAPLLIVFVSNMLLVGQNVLYTTLAGLQVLFYILAALGWYAASAGVRIPLVSTAALFLLGNTAGMVGAMKALVGQRMARWEPVR